MRLRVLENGQSLLRRILLRLIALKTGRPPDVLRAALYRPKYFGASYLSLVHEVMRGPSEWTVGERELLAAQVSVVNGCAYCIVDHTAVSSAALGPDVVNAALADPATAPVTGKVRAALPFVAKLATAPAAVTRADVEALRKAGVSDAAIEDAAHVVFSFSLVNRLADAFGFEPFSGEAADRVAAMLLARGYKL